MSEKSQDKTPEIKVESGHEWKEYDPLTVKGKDPEMAYRWNAKKNMEKKLAQGWKPVETGEGVYHETFGEKKKDYVETGDLVLCKMPREKADARKQFYHNKANRAFNRYDDESIQANFEEQARKAGVSAFGGIKIEGQQKLKPAKKYVAGWRPDGT